MSAPASRPVPRLPRDPALTGLAMLLEAGGFLESVGSLAATELDDQSWPARPEYVRYKPGTNAVASWRVNRVGGGSMLLHGKCYTAEDYPVALAKAREIAASEPGREFAARDDARMLCFAFPADQVMDGLRFATTPKKIQRVLYAHDDALEEKTWRVSDSRMAISTVRFKPEKRAVLRIDTRARHRVSGEKRPVRRWLRITAGDGGEVPAALTARLHDEFSLHPWLQTPRMIAWLPRYGGALLDHVPGLPLPADTAGTAVAGRALAALHRASAADLPRRTRDQALTDAGDALEAAAGVAPEIAADVVRIRDGLADLASRLGPDEHVGFVHGDFHPQQILLCENGAAILDFDRSHAGDPVADLGNFTAQLLAESYHGGRNPEYARALGETLRQAYELDAFGPVEANRFTFWRAIGLAHLVPQAFRSLRSDWPVLTGVLVAACLRELS